jgi:hypothetical protein
MQLCIPSLSFVIYLQPLIHVKHWQNCFSIFGGHVIKWNLSSTNDSIFPVISGAGVLLFEMPGLFFSISFPVIPSRVFCWCFAQGNDPLLGFYPTLHDSGQLLLPYHMFLCEQKVLEEDTTKHSSVDTSLMFYQQQ